MNKTKIDWCDMVWNPVTGCTKVSDGCRNCYAEGVARRFWGERKFGDVRCHEERLDAPLKAKKPSKIFVNSMSDLFHPDVPDDFIAKVFAIMALSEQHTFMVLTKRPKRMAEFTRFKQLWTMVQNYTESWSDFSPDFTNPLPNVWLGVSVEDQKTADERIPMLINTLAEVRFVSCEPLLEKILIGQYLGYGCDNDGIDWVISGAETGQRARPCDLDWLRSIRDECLEAEIPFFLKSVDKWHNQVLDSETWRQFPEVSHG